MNYELAKELKEAGFPTPKAGAFVTLIDENGIWNPYKFEDGIPAYPRIPTLEELIEACGNDFSILRSMWPTSCLAYSAENGDGAGDGLVGEGSTPSEAVARLWLALNKK